MKIKLLRNWILVIAIGHCFQMSGLAQEIESEEDSVVYDFIPDVHYDSIQNRLLQITSDMPLHFNTKVKGFIDYFTVRNREYTRNALANSNYYFPIFEKYLKQYGLPDDLKYLSIIESGLNPRAISSASAVGLWQFVSSTGSYYDLHQDWYIDERMDPYAASEAACKYLKQLHDYFDDWELALAAYNSGPGRVRRAIRRSGYKKGFWEIYPWLPRETRSYVPQFVAITYALNFAAEHNIFIEEPNYAIDYDTVLVSKYFHLPTFADQINVCMDDLEKLNPHVKRGALPENTHNFDLRIPIESKEFVVSNRSMLYDTASKVGQKELDYLSRSSVGSTYGRDQIRYIVKSGDVLGTIAIKYGVRVTDLMKWNNLSGNLIRIGQNLNVWVLPTYYSRLNSKPIAKTVQTPVELDGKKIHYVEPGDTLWDISRMYEGLTVERLRQLNELDNNNIKPGMPLVIGDSD
ncbi:MAG: LysM peptidoglycan-binding domain-containing protein [Bacteroidetes bacterium]|nr:LysM peptidoglycan-binding domain-containing protein [Bacteroidota bacterium]MDA1122003.1 LysM peptidoglycan-binding domain-containing protein [Bacteroidota bacterium]